MNFFGSGRPFCLGEPIVGIYDLAELFFSLWLRSAFLRKQATLQPAFQPGNEIDTADRTLARFRPAQGVVLTIVAVFGKESRKVPGARQNHQDRNAGIVAVTVVRVLILNGQRKKWSENCRMSIEFEVAPEPWKRHPALAQSLSGRMLPLDPVRICPVPNPAECRQGY